MNKRDYAFIGIIVVLSLVMLFLSRNYNKEIRAIKRQNKELNESNAQLQTQNRQIDDELSNKNAQIANDMVAYDSLKVRLTEINQRIYAKIPPSNRITLDDEIEFLTRQLNESSSR